MIYCLIAWHAVREPIRSSRITPRGMPPVTMLKPRAGAEPGNVRMPAFLLRSRNIRKYQMVFGVADADEFRLRLLSRGCKVNFRRFDLQISIERRQHGSSRKVAIYQHDAARAARSGSVLSDSDAEGQAATISRVAAPLIDKSVGIVTCLDRGIPRARIVGRSWDRFSSMNGLHRRYVWQPWPARDPSHSAQRLGKAWKC